MIPAGLSPRAFLGRDAVSFSELSTLAQCEAKWHYAYNVERDEEIAGSKAMRLGTEVHRLWGTWQMDRTWGESDDETAAWLMGRYVEMYDAEWQHVAFRDVEMPLVARLPWGPQFFGWADGLADKDDELWLVELKTTANLSAVQYLTQTLQTRLYVWALRQMGYPVVGALLDVIRSHRPKLQATRDKMPLAESFERRWLRFEDAEIAAALAEAQAATGIRRALQAGDRVPLRAVGPSCGWCPFIGPCHGLEVEVIPEDDDLSILAK